MSGLYLPQTFKPYRKMKKILLIAAVGCFVMTSCKKDYTCECTFSGNGISGSTSATIHETKSKATTACEAGSSSLGGTTTTCKIK
jgi:hypothetical protein